MNRALAALFAARERSPCLDDGSRSLTAGDLRAAVESDATALRCSDARVVALDADNGTGWAIADLALALAAVPVVPLPGYFTTTQMAHAVDSSAVDTLLTARPEYWRALDAGFRPMRALLQSGLTAMRRDVDAARLAAAALPHGTAKITFTSGSTGSPKGVCLSQPTLDAVVDAVVDATAVSRPDRHLCTLPLATLLENVAGLHAALASGACCVLPPCRNVGMSGTSLDVPVCLRAIQAHRPASLILVPQMLLALVMACESGWSPPSSLRFIAVGGARCGAGLLERAASAGLPVYEGYGLSECASVIALNVPGASRAGTVGRVLPHAQVRIAADGEIVVSGNVMSGYVGATQPPPTEIATGDLGRLDADGYLAVTGRKKDLFVNAFGRNVSPEWVESELLAEGAGQTLVYGEARPYNVALIGSQDLAAARIRRAIAAANRRLPAYARVDRWTRLPEPFHHDNGTLTANGRLRRAVVLRRYRERIDSLYAADFATS